MERQDRNPQITIHRLDPELHEDLHKFLELYAKSVCANGDESEAVFQQRVLNALQVLAQVPAQLGRIEAKITVPDGEVVTEADRALARDIRDLARSTKLSVKALDEKTPSAAEPGVNG